MFDLKEWLVFNVVCFFPSYVTKHFLRFFSSPLVSTFASSWPGKLHRISCTDLNLQGEFLRGLFEISREKTFVETEGTPALSANLSRRPCHHTRHIWEKGFLMTAGRKSQKQSHVMAMMNMVYIRKGEQKHCTQHTWWCSNPQWTQGYELLT